MQDNPNSLEKLHEKIDALYEHQVLENKAVFTKKDILRYIGWGNINSKEIVEGYEKMGLLKSLGGRPKVYPGRQVRKLKERLDKGLLNIPDRKKVRSL
jgi:hypothetical protein